MADAMDVGARCLAVIPARRDPSGCRGRTSGSWPGSRCWRTPSRAARRSELFDRVVVSTDSPEIAAIAEAAGAEVPFLRSADLADDFTQVSLVTLDALDRLDPAGDRYPIVAQLMPTCPLRGAEDVRASYHTFRMSGAASQISVTRFGWQILVGGGAGLGGVLEPVFRQFVQARGQDLPPLFCPTGAVWWASASKLRRSGPSTSRVAGDGRFQLALRVDIDSEDDWRLAELLLAAPAASESRP